MKASPKPSVTSSASARFAYLSLLSVTGLCLTGCKTPSPTLPEPPIVACEQGATPNVKPPPIATKGQWLNDGPAWAVEVLGVLRQERAYRSAEHECLSRLRSQSVIR